MDVPDVQPSPPLPSCLLLYALFCKFLSYLDVFWYGNKEWYMIWYDIWYDMIWYDMIWYDMIWYDMIWYDIWYDMIWYDMIWYDYLVCRFHIYSWGCQYFERIYAGFYGDLKKSFLSILLISRTIKNIKSNNNLTSNTEREASIVYHMASWRYILYPYLRQTCVPLAR